MLLSVFLNNKNKGFTLIELLVVISIISLLSSIIMVPVQDARTKSKVAKVKADMIQIRNAAELYKTDNGNYPATTTDMIPKYLSMWPISPLGGVYGIGIEIQAGNPVYYCGINSNYNVEIEQNRLFVYLDGAKNFPTTSFDKYYIGVNRPNYGIIANKGPCIE